MAKKGVRLTNIKIENFKNVKMGEIDLSNKRKNFKSSILGLYGQNGSGKTALVDAIQLLKYTLCGQSIPSEYADYINVDALSSTFFFQFNINIGDSIYEAWYQFSMKMVQDDEQTNFQDDDIEKIKSKVEVFDEVLSYSCLRGEHKVRKSPLIDTRTREVFIPKKKCDELIGTDKSKMMDLLVTKRITQTTSRSFIFSREMINAFRKNCSNEEYLSLIETLVIFANTELFIIKTRNSGLISMNALPLAFNYKGENVVTYGKLMMPLDSVVPISEEEYDIVKKIIDNMNIVLKQIVPDLTIDVVDLGTVLLKNGNTGRSIQLMSLKNGKAIPFKYESEGIKKIVSILQLLIVVYNSSSITVAIDEIDAGIFEYLLGEMLNIISEKGKGQLIFTSHNLRPLETIDKGFIAFTTTNPNKRYARMTNVKQNNNLRDFYYRDIVLGEQNEQLYNPTNNFEISLAFREAGEAFGS
jgi:AAA15 family ATPase/GTPase